MLGFDSIFEKGSEENTLLTACDCDRTPCDVCQSGPPPTGKTEN